MEAWGKLVARFVGIFQKGIDWERDYRPMEEYRLWISQFNIGNPIKSWAKPEFDVMLAFEKQHPLLTLRVNTLDADVKDRITNITLHHDMKPGRLLDRATFHEEMRRMLHEVMTHECDEAIRVGGVKPYDPHSPRYVENVPSPVMRKRSAK